MNPSVRPVTNHSRSRAAGRRRWLAIALCLVSLFLLGAGLAAGSNGWRWPFEAGGDDASGSLILYDIRLPRTLGAWLTGALLGVAGAIAQGLFRNPLADPYLLGSASGASLAVMLVLSAGALTGASPDLAASAMVEFFRNTGLVLAAFVGALGGVLLTLVLARGAEQSIRLLLAGVVVGVVLGAIGELLSSYLPEILAARQAFMLGSTGFIGWSGVVLLAAGAVVVLPVGWRFARGLDALALGEETARSLGLSLIRLRVLLIACLALATALAVSQAGLIPFVGLVAPHLVRRFAPGLQAFVVPASGMMGGCLLLSADLLARTLISPAELPVGVLSAVLGGGYLLWLLHRRPA
ncbi:MAG: FecCD family ABC transporter permease [Burkholderiaceae bacterium]